MMRVIRIATVALGLAPGLATGPVPAQRLDAIPQVGTVTREGRAWCGGTQVGDDLVVTAGHCLAGKVGDRDAIGSDFAFVTPGGVGAAVALARHPTLDLGLLRLGAPVRREGLSPIGVAAVSPADPVLRVVSPVRGARRVRDCPQLEAGSVGVILLACPVRKGDSGAGVISMAGDTPELAGVVTSRAVRGGRDLALAVRLTRSHLGLLRTLLPAAE